MRNEEIIFNYIRDIIYDTENASIDLNCVDGDYRSIAGTLIFLGRLAAGEYALPEKLTGSVIKASFPGGGKALEFPLDALCSCLQHFVRQARLIQKNSLKDPALAEDFLEIFNSLKNDLENSGESLEAQVFRDPLTKLFNRRYMMEALKAVIRKKRRFSLCFVDLDNLKYVNDAFGHLEGDKFIVSVADRLCGDFPEGVAGRIGGDEYMVLLPCVSEAEAIRRMDELCAGLACSDGRGRHPLSYGVIEVKENNALTLNQILAEADKRMYILKAKHKTDFRYIAGPQQQADFIKLDRPADRKIF